jgi:seryl-tRNA synthetase
MLDIRLLRDDLEQVKKRMATRGIEIDWGEFLSLDRQRRVVFSCL